MLSSPPPSRVKALFLSVAIGDTHKHQLPPHSLEGQGLGFCVNICPAPLGKWPCLPPEDNSALLSLHCAMMSQFQTLLVCCSGEHSTVSGGEGQG